MTSTRRNPIRSTARRRLATPVGVLVGALVSALALAACGGGSSDNPLDTTNTGGAQTPSTKAIIVGSANFPESTLLAQIYITALQAKNIQVKPKLNIGSREAYLPALKDGSIDLIPEYTGNLLQYYDDKDTSKSPAAVYAALSKAVPSGLTVLEQSKAQDSDAVVVTQQTAQQNKLTSIADLKPVAGGMKLGGPGEWKTRKNTGVPALKSVYDVVFGQFIALDAGGPLTKNALKSGQVQAANVFTTDTDIPKNNWVVLTDPKHMFAAQNIVPLISQSKVTDEVKSVLNEVSSKLDTQTLLALNGQVANDKKDPSAVAKAWVTGGMEPVTTS